jgi:hypothetical protein
MNFKTTYILFGGLAVILVVLGVTLFMGPSATNESKFLLSSLRDKDQQLKPGEVDRVDRIEIKRTKPDEETLAFVKDASTKHWKVNGLRADSGKVSTLIQQLFNADKAKSDEPPKNLADWDLSPPNTVITISRSDQPALIVNLGKVSVGDETAVVYATSSDRPKDAIAVQKNKLELALKGLTAFRDRDMVPATSADLKSLEFALGKDRIGLVKEGATWRYTAPERCKGAAAADSGGFSTPDENKAPTSVSALISDLIGIKVPGEKGEDFVADDVTEKDLAKYHLGKDDDKLLITFKRTEENLKDVEDTLVVGIGKKIENKDDKTEKYYAYLKGENNVVRIPAKSVASIRKLIADPDALRDKHLVKAELGKQPDAIVINRPADKVTIEFLKRRGSDLAPSEPFGPRAVGSWQMYRGDEASDVQEDVVSRLAALLTDNSVESFPDKNAKESDLGVDDKSKATAVVEVWLDGIVADEKKDEKKDDKKDDKKKDEKKAKPKLKDPKKPTATLIFGIKGPNKTVAVKRIAEGETPTLLWVKEVVLDEASKKPLEYMSKTLPSFADVMELDITKNVTRVELTRDGKPYVIVSEAGKDKDAKRTWKFEKPDELQGRKADDAKVFLVLQTLARLHAVNLKAEKATKDALESIYGLDGPKTLRASVTVVKKVGDKDETTKYDFAFGNNDGETEQFAKQSQRDMIFTVLKTDLAPLQAELLDTTILTFDPSKVKAVKLVGWKSVVGGKPRTIELESKGNDQWTVKGEADTVANAFNVNSLLKTLSNLKAEKFVAYNVKEVDQAYGLDVNKDGLTITITLDGQKDPIELTIGKLDGDKGYFAMSPQAKSDPKSKGDVFYLKKTDFEGPLSKPGYFFQ